MNSLIYKRILKRENFRYKYLCYRRNVTLRAMLKALWLWYVKRDRRNCHSFSHFVLRTIGRIPVSTDFSAYDQTMSARNGARLADMTVTETEKFLGTNYEVVRQPAPPSYHGYHLLYDTLFRKGLSLPRPDGPRLESGVSRSCLPLFRVTYLGTKYQISQQPGMSEIYHHLKRNFRAIDVGDDVFIVCPADDECFC